MRLFGGERVKNFMESLAGDEDVPLELGLLTKQIENAQKRIEGNNFNIRKNVLQYDDVMNTQREIIYKQRRQVLMGEDISGNISEMMQNAVYHIVGAYCDGSKYPEEWDFEGMYSAITKTFGVAGQKYSDADKDKLKIDDIKQDMLSLVKEGYVKKEAELAEAGLDMRDVERIVLLKAVDNKWMDHIDAMDQFRKGIGLRAYAQRDPIVEYKMEGYDMFDEMVAGIQEETIYMLFHVTVRSKIEQKERKVMNTNGGEGPAAPAKAEKTVGRNSPCPCGSGKKYKNCCGKNA